MDSDINPLLGVLDAAPEQTLALTLLTASEVAAILRIPVKKVYRIALPQVRVSDRRVRFIRSDVAAYIRQHRRGA